MHCQESDAKDANCVLMWVLKTELEKSSSTCVKGFFQSESFSAAVLMLETAALAPRKKKKCWDRPHQEVVFGAAVRTKVATWIPLVCSENLLLNLPCFLQTRHLSFTNMQSPGRHIENKRRIHLGNNVRVTLKRGQFVRAAVCID